MIEHVGNLFAFVGGLGMFLYGMNIMADGLQKSAGGKMKQLLGYLTNNRILGIIMGALVTAIIQSSSATTVMVVGFVNAGILTLTQAVGVIMGANIGTTITAWLVSASEWAAFAKPEFIAPLILGVGAFVMLFTKSQKTKMGSEIAIGFGILFIGLSSMSSAISVYKDSPIFAQAFATLGGNPVLGILTGAVVTALIQSSSASVGILQTLALNGIVNWPAAIFITLGQNIGTCITALISSMGANRTAKRAASIHLMFNVAGAVIFAIIMSVVFHLSPAFTASKVTSTGISIFHTIFNISNTLILFPFAGLLVKLSGILIKGEEVSEEEMDEEEAVLRHLDERILETPSFAVENAVKEVVRMGEIVSTNLKTAMDGILTDKPETSIVDKVVRKEKMINNLEKMLTEYLIKISNLSLTERQVEVVNNLFYTVSDMERVGDHAENLAEFINYRIDHEIEFSKTAEEELRSMCDTVLDCYNSSVKARETEEVEYIRRVVNLEDDIDNMEEELRETHIERLSSGKCRAEVGVIFLDAISNLERVADHAVNIAGYVKDEIK
ncbi:MAG: Na/Pi cotransporter family protein [Lachnospiraceae bacterium]|nr:Na/Pi cotransporter family protein [Lachnospiraceae bacterium]